ncbi:MAG: hypothetical protein ACYC91_16770 [Solirubrobacteraceae bacterium]
MRSLTAASLAIAATLLGLTGAVSPAQANDLGVLGQTLINDVQPVGLGITSDGGAVISWRLTPAANGSGNPEVTQLGTCKVPSGSGACASTQTLTADPGAALGGPFVVAAPSGLQVESLDGRSQASDSLRLQQWSSTDGGNSFGAVTTSMINFGSLLNPALDQYASSTAGPWFLVASPLGQLTFVTATDAFNFDDNPLLQGRCCDAALTAIPDGAGGGLPLVVAADDKPLSDPTGASLVWAHGTQASDLTSANSQWAYATAPFAQGRHPRLASGPSGTYLLYAPDSRSDLSFYVSKWTGTGFTTPVAIPGSVGGVDGAFSVYPSTIGVAADGSVVVVGVGHVGGRDGLVAWRSTNGAQSFDSGTLISRHIPDGRITLALSNGGGLVAFAENGGVSSTTDPVRLADLAPVPASPPGGGGPGNPPPPNPHPPVPIFGTPPASSFPGVAAVSRTGNPETLWVDGAGTAHVAVISQDEHGLFVCTVKPGARVCGSPRLVYRTSTAETLIAGVRHVVDASGHDDLAVGLFGVPPYESELGPNLSIGRLGDGKEARTLAPRLCTGSCSGHSADTVELLLTPAGNGGFRAQPVGYVITDDLGLTVGLGLDPAPGAAYLEPDASRLLVLGVGDDRQLYEEDPLVAGAPHSRPVALADGTLQQPGARRLVGLDKLPGGRTAVFSTLSRRSSTQLQGQYAVQATPGGAFGPWRPLGVGGYFSTTSSPSGGSYVLAIGISRHAGALPLTLTGFQSFGLGPALAMGTAIAGSQAVVTEDGAGDVHAVWQSTDLCPRVVGGCLTARVAHDGHRTDPEQGFGTATAPLGGTPTAVASNDRGVTWALAHVALHAGDFQTAAILLPGVADVLGRVKITATAARVGLGCVGAVAPGCQIQAQLLVAAPGARKAMDAATRGARVLGSASKLIAPRRHASLTVRLSRAGRAYLRRHPHTRLRLRITESTKLTPRPTTVLDRGIRL